MFFGIHLCYNIGRAHDVNYATVLSITNKDKCDLWFEKQRIADGTITYMDSTLFLHHILMYY